MMNKKNKTYIPQSKYFAILVFTALTGCTTVGPDYKAPTVDIPEQWSKQSDKNELNVSNRLDWWLTFNDEVLNTLITQAQKQNLTLKQAALRIFEARAILDITNANKYPYTSLNSSATLSKQSDHAQPFPLDDSQLYSFGFDSSWELDLWGRQSRQRESAVASHLAMIANYGDIAVSISAEVAATYIQIRTYEQRLKLVKESISLQERSLEIAKAWFENGGRTELDLQQARALVFETKSQLPSIEQALHQQETALAVLLGTHRLNLIDKLKTQSTIPTSNKIVDIGIPTDILRRRPDIRYSEFQTKIQYAELGVSEAEYYPSLSLNGSFGFGVTTDTSTKAGGLNGSSLSDLFSSDAIQYSTGIGFSWNIFNFGRIENNIKATDARLQVAIESYKHSVLLAVKETEDAIVSINKSRQYERLLNQSANSYDRASSLSIQQYTDGAIDYQSVLDTLRQVVSVKQKHAEATGQIALNLVTLYKTLGGGWSIESPIILSDETVFEMEERTNWDGSLKGSSD
ncbi:MAG: efflux transporter outer membrane subunit [Colwellia sp.]|nr:efflux transporter outer membrane subunit [Colwellia sp.]MCW8863292.1 efflux transporter outer membrane subunit [Colwellia sp.]MCW9081275.1 efflux transporter outer membrane subunit [Colwellia sp.]